MNIIKQKKGREEGPSIRTIQKIQDHLQEAETLLTLTEISQQTKTHYQATKYVIDFLDKLGMVEIQTNGKTTFVRIRDNERTD